MFNEIDGSYDDVAISTFGLPAEHDLRKSLTSKPVTSVRLLMDRIDKYRRIEEDQLQEIQSTVIKTCTAIIIKITVILLKIVGTCGTIWNSWSEKGG